MMASIIATAVSAICGLFGIVALWMGLRDEMKAPQAFFGFLFFMFVAYMAALGIGT